MNLTIINRKGAGMTCSFDEDNGDPIAFLVSVLRPGCEIEPERIRVMEAGETPKRRATDKPKTDKAKVKRAAKPAVSADDKAKVMAALKDGPLTRGRVKEVTGLGDGAVKAALAEVAVSSGKGRGAAWALSAGNGA